MKLETKYCPKFSLQRANRLTASVQPDVRLQSLSYNIPIYNTSFCMEARYNRYV
ncbi:hypothetical protein SCLCIDRAFT_1219870, partial [Scleroderma citrinum Foug A]